MSLIEIAIFILTIFNGLFWCYVMDTFIHISTSSTHYFGITLGNSCEFDIKINVSKIESNNVSKYYLFKNLRTEIDFNKLPAIYFQRTHTYIHTAKYIKLSSIDSYLTVKHIWLRKLGRLW